jgi:hypothetical protein
MCPVHCFKPEMREKIKTVMRFSGPLMIYRHPIIGLQHLWFRLRSRKKRASRFPKFL